MTLKVPLNDLARYTNLYSSELVNLASRVIKSGQYFNGPETIAFVLSMTAFLDHREFIPLANGTDALILALESLELEAGSSVAMMPNAGGYGSVAAVRAGLKPIYVDVQLLTAQMCPIELEKILTSNKSVGAVIVTHLYGVAGEIALLRDICSKFGVPLIEDCAQSFGGKFQGKNLGTFGDISTFSFYPTKNLGALGDAGGISTNNELLATRIRQLAQYGWANRYEISLDRGFNSRIDEIQASFLNHNLRYLDEWNTRRRNIVTKYSQAVSGGRRMIGNDDLSFVAHLAILVSSSRERDRQFLSEAGIETGLHYPILDFDQIAWKDEASRSHFPKATNLCNSIVTLPCFPMMSDREVDHVCQTLQCLP